MEFSAESDTGRIRIVGRQFVMRRVVSASGAKYEAENDPATVFWSKGARATLTLHGQEYPECMQVSGAAAERQVFRARGNEPGWTLEITPEGLTLVADYGEKRIAAPEPDIERGNGFLRYRADSQNLVVTVHDRICHDDATGMPHPKAVTVQLGDRSFRGCGGEPSSLLAGPEWVVEQIGGSGLIDGSRITLQFREDGRVVGAASCNSYNATYTLSPVELEIGEVTTTMRACAPNLMDQEQRFLSALAEVRRFEIGTDGNLILHIPADGTIAARR